MSNIKSSLFISCAGPVLPCAQSLCGMSHAVVCLFIHFYFYFLLFPGNDGPLNDEYQ